MAASISNANLAGADKRSRIEWVDVAKGLGIILVSFGHLRNGDGQSVWLPALNPLISAIYLFHMPLFFFLAGITFSGRGSFAEFIKRKAKTLLVPYFVFSLYFLAKPIACLLVPTLAASFQTAHNYEIASQLFDVLVMGNGHWFLMALFFAELFMYWLARMLKDERNYLAVGILLILAYHVMGSLGIAKVIPFQLARAVEVVGFMCFGFALKGRIHSAIRMETLIGGFAAFFLTGVFAYVSLGTENAITRELFSIFTALAGTAAFVFLSKLLAGIKPLAYIGRCSLCFYVVNALCLNIAKLGMFRVAHLDLTVAIMPVQLAGGVICTALAMILMQLMNLLIRRWLPWAIGLSPIGYTHE